MKKLRLRQISLVPSQPPTPHTGYPAQAGSPQITLPDTHRLHYLGTPGAFLFFLGLRENLGARGDV